MINIIGLGYIGLPTALILASKGNIVVGTDVNEELIQKLNSNQVSFEEEGLFELYTSAKKNDIQFSLDYQTADTYIVTVPTPYVKETKKINSEYIIRAVKSIIAVAPDKFTLVIESTVSPGTIDKEVRPILKETSKQVDLVHAPERILPGAMISELEKNSRTIGADSYEVGLKIKNLYETFCEGEICITDINTAEMSKVVENTFRDINIAFANELAQICREAKLDVYEVIRISNKHPRVNVLNPGPGVGGHCISVDPWFLVGDYPEQSKLIQKARETNDAMPAYVLSRLKEIMVENNITSLKEVGIYGLSYKENVDDVRESPTLQLLELIENQGGDLPVIFDPYINTEIVSNQVFGFNEFINEIKLMVVLVAHNELNYEDIPKEMIVFDTKNSTNTDDRKVYKL